MVFSYRSPFKKDTGIIPRARLISRLEKEIHRHRAVLINAPAGSGKSTILSQYLHQRSSPCIWYNVTSEDRDPNKMLNFIASSLSRKYPDSTRHLHFIFDKTGEEETVWSVTCRNILDAFSLIGETEVYLIVDDTHKVDEAEDFWKILDFLFQKAPENLYIAISARNMRKLRYSKSVLYDQVGLFTNTDLNFTITEVQQLIHEKSGSATREDAERIHKLCGGWPLGVNLMVQRSACLSDHSGFQKIELNQLCSDSNFPKYFPDYLAEEFLKDFPPGAKDFLIDTSVFNSFNTEMCETLLEINDSEAFIVYLLDQSLVRAWVHSGETWYECPDLFRHFFLDVAKRRKPPEEWAHLHEKTAEYFISRNVPLEAMRYYVAGEAYEKALSVLEKHLEDFIAQSAAGALLPLVEKIPDCYMTTRSILFLAKGWALFFLGDARESLHLIGKGLHIVQKEENAGYLGRYILVSAHIHFMLDEYGELESFLKKSIRRLPPDNFAYPEILQMLALALGQLGRLNEAEALWNEIEGHPLVQNDLQRAFGFAAIKAYNFAFLLGRFDEAEQVLHKGLEVLRVKGDMISYARILGYYSSVKYIKGFFGDCRELVEQAVLECEKTEQVFAQRPFLLLQAMNALESGRPETAKAVLDKCKGNFDTIDALLEKQKSYVWKGYLLYAVQAALSAWEGYPAKFRNDAETAIHMVEQKESFLDVYFLYTFLAPIFVRMKLPERARDLLETLDSFISPVETPYFKAHTWLLLSSVLYKLGQVGPGRTALQKAVRTAKAHQYDYLFLNKERGVTLELLQLLINEEEDFDFIAHILVNLAPSPPFELIHCLKKEGSDRKKIGIIRALADNKCMDFERDMLACTVDRSGPVRQAAKTAAKKIRRLPPLPLTVCTLGRFRLQVGNREVQPGAWKRKKSISLFNFLLMNPNREITADRLMELFFPESSPDKARGHVQALVSHLRRLLEPGLPGKQESRYIKAGNGVYMFQLPENSYVDGFEFDRLVCEAAEAKKSGFDFDAFVKTREAAALYLGNFLPEALYEHWTEIHRQHYAAGYDKMLYELAEHYFNRQEYADCETNLQILINREPLEEKAYLLLMKCQAAQNHRTRAMKTYLKCRVVLQNELGILPDQSLADFYQRLRNTSV